MKKFQISFKRHALVALASLVVVGSITGCARVREHVMPHSSESFAISADDAMFLQMMIPHHQQAIEMATMAATQSESKKIRILARGIKEVQSLEVTKMKSWLSRAGYPTSDPGMGMGVDGMLTEDQMAGLRAAQGSAFDDLFLAGMIQHHQGAITMAQDEVDNGTNKKVQVMAAAVIATQTAEVAAMKAMQAVGNN